MNLNGKIKIPLRRYTKEELLTMQEDKQVPIVEGILYENDYVLLVSKPKVGKSILALQLASSISSGKDFLGTFHIPKPQRVWYFATEGKDEDIKDRLARIKQLVEIDPDNFVLFCSAGFRFNTDIGKEAIKYLTQEYKNELPKVIIIDALYLAVKGSLKDDDVINEFNYIIRGFAEYCDASIIIVHHTKKPTMIEGHLVESNLKMDDVFGSIFLPASADHIFHFDMDSKTKLRHLVCESQRSGEVIENMTLILQEPSPLGFIPIPTEPEQINPIEEYLKLNPQGLTIKELMKKTNFSRENIYRVLKQLKDKVEKTKERPVKYIVCKDA